MERTMHNANFSFPTRTLAAVGFHDLVWRDVQTAHTKQYCSAVRCLVDTLNLHTN